MITKHKMNQLISQLDIYQISVFSLVFFLFTIIGTLSHEGSHYIVADYFGLRPILHFGNITFGKDIKLLSIDPETHRQLFLSSVAGPLQTIVTGTIGFTILLYRNKNKPGTFSSIDFGAVFLSLFWLRECFNLATVFIFSIYNGTFTMNGDEAYISQYLGLNLLCFNVILGVIGTVLCYFTVFVLLPQKYRLNLIVACFFGSCFGFVTWFYFLGKILLP